MIVPWLDGKLRFGFYNPHIEKLMPHYFKDFKLGLENRTSQGCLRILRRTWRRR